MPAGPDAVEAITRTQEVGGAGLSLRDLFTAAVFRMQRAEGSDTALAVLREWRDAREDSTPGPRLRDLEARTVVRAFGPGVIDQAAAVVSGELQEASLAAERVMSMSGDVPPARAALDSAARAIAGARQRQAWSAEQALLALDDAAQQIAAVRVSLVDADRFPTLDELYARALDGDGADLAWARGTESRLLEDARSAETGSDVDRRYSALEALRRHRAEVIIGTMGADVAQQLLSDMDSYRQSVDSLLGELDARGTEVVVDRRMLETVTQIRDRAAASLEAGDAPGALDLITHAAGLLDELRRRRAR